MFSSSVSTSRQILTVTKLNRLARTVLEGEIGLIWLSAEISNFVRAASGHWYFTLKDQKAQVRAAMFKNANRSIRVLPKEGDKVLVRASVGLYEARGDYQLVVEHLESDGEGALKQAYEALKAKLNTQGLFDTSRKRSIPQVINKVGVITSSSGAALHDILSVLKRRSPQIEVIVYPSMVQGEQASQQLLNALRTAQARNEVDVLLLTRGGGSLEDLWCFNDETLARAIATCALPIVSAVGHEVDFTIADFVADVRAPTPSAAAELISQDVAQLFESLGLYQRRLSRSIASIISTNKHQHEQLKQRITAVHPQSKIQSQQQSIDYRLSQLRHLAAQLLSKKQRSLTMREEALRRQSPEIMLNKAQSQISRSNDKLIQLMTALLEQHKSTLASNAALLNSVSPLSTLARGYSITLQEDSAVTRLSDVKNGDVIRTRVTDGEITSKVTGTSAK